jgi:hypothetical protein
MRAFSFAATALILSCAEPVFSLAAPPHLRMGVSLYGTGAESVESQSRIAGTEIEAFYQRPLSTDWELRLAGGIQLETGAARLRWAEDFRPRQIQRLRQAFVQWSPFEGGRFTLGATDQQEWNAPLLLQRQSFPSLQESYSLRSGAWRLSLQAQQSVPADTSSLQPWGNWPEGMPSFYLERVGLSFSPNEETALSLHVSHFLFENLSSPSAFQAQFLGNTIVGVGPTANYQYGFQGFESGFHARTRWGAFQPEWSVSGLLNSSAPSGKSTAFQTSLKVQWNASPRFHLSPQVEWFRAESDAAPAFYNDRVFGHGNREGFGLTLLALWPADQIQATARWVHSSVLTSNPYQSDLDWVQLQLSTQYDLF